MEQMGKQSEQEGKTKTFNLQYNKGFTEFFVCPHCLSDSVSLVTH